MTDCPVCYDAYTGVVRRPVPCPGCGFAACARCVKTGLLSSLTEPACMSCHRAWNRAFLDEHLARTWVSGPLHEHRGAVLFDRERSLLPATQGAVAIEKRKREARAALAAIEAERAPLAAAAKEARKTFQKIEDDYYDGTASVAQLKEARKVPRAANAALREFDATHTTGELAYVIRYGYSREEARAGAAEAAEPERARFVAACPRGDCRGFLSTQYKCGTCAVQFCSKCREPKAEGHECDPDLVATIAAIVADSRPCPSCATPISRVSGCDQMWCTECRTPFSYATGLIVKGVIHNPHYFQQRAADGAAAAAGGGEAACGMDAMRQMEVVLWHMLGRDREVLGETYAAVTERYYSFVDLRDRVLAEYHDPRRPVDNTDLRVQFLLNDFDEAVFKQKLSVRQRDRDFRAEIHEVLETAVGALLEFFMTFRWQEVLLPADVEGPIAELEAKREPLINAPLREIAARYGRVGVVVGADWRTEKWVAPKAKAKAAAGGGS